MMYVTTESLYWLLKLLGMFIESLHNNNNKEKSGELVVLFRSLLNRRSNLFLFNWFEWIQILWNSKVNQIDLESYLTSLFLIKCFNHSHSSTTYSMFRLGMTSKDC